VVSAFPYIQNCARRPEKGGKVAEDRGGQLHFEGHYRATLGAQYHFVMPVRPEEGRGKDSRDASSASCRRASSTFGGPVLLHGVRHSQASSGSAGQKSNDFRISGARPKPGLKLNSQFQAVKRIEPRTLTKRGGHRASKKRNGQNQTMKLIVALRREAICGKCHA